jgi:hypothetical protein
MRDPKETHEVRAEAEAEVQNCAIVLITKNNAGSAHKPESAL